MAHRWQARASKAGTPVNLFSRFFADQTGTTAVEYGLIAGATCLALGAAMPSLHAKLADTYAKIGSFFN